MQHTEKVAGPTHGWVAIHDGVLQVQDPQDGGQPAVISADDSVSVFVDDLPIHSPTEVFSQTPIRIHLPFRTLPEYSCEFTLSPDRCALDLTIHQQQPGCFYALPETGPVPQLLIQAETREVPLSAFGEDITQSVMQELQQRRIREGLRPERIAEALAHPGLPVRLAESTPAVAPENWLEDLFALPEPRPDQPAGFQLTYPALKRCKAGELLVMRHQDEAGRPGLTVYGEVIPLPPRPERPLKSADGSVKIDRHDNTATARLEGIPSFNGREARVAALDQRSASLNGGPGAIEDIKGTAQINGDVQELHLWASQHIEISGNVSHARLEAHEHLLIHGNTIRSQLYAGGDAAACMRLLEPVSALYLQMEQMLQMLRELHGHLPKSPRPDDRLLLVRLIKTQFPKLPGELDALWKLNQSLKQLHPRRTMVLKVVLANLLNLAEKPVDERIFTDWIDKLRSFLDDLQQLEPQRSHIYLSYAQGSQLLSRGSIFFLGEGCYNSEIQAGEHIFFCGTPGYCREGSLRVGGNLWVPELGSPNGSRLEVQLSLQSRVEAQKIHPGVELIFGERYRHHVLTPQTHVQVVCAEGEVRFLPVP